MSDRVVPVAFLHVRFAFPPEARHACLPVPSPFGLIYPRTGTTTCTGPEVALALQMGAAVEVMNGVLFATQWTADMSSRLAFAQFLSIITQERAKHPKKSLANKLLKELANSFYGKMAQGVEFKTKRDLRGESKTLRGSRITCPHFAAMCTGLVRAALAAVIWCAEQFPGVSVLSATTDGCMLRIPFKGSIPFDADGKPIAPHLQDVLPGLYEKLEQLYPIRMLKAGRENMGLDPHGWLESKHLGNEALTVKTRGYLLRWDGVPTFLAKCGHKIKGANDLEALYYDEDIKSLVVRTMVSIQDIADGRHVDLVHVETSRRANTDYDYKRVLLPDGSTVLAESVAEVILNRLAADTVRRRGRRATPEAVALNRSGVHQHGGSEAAMRRQILRAVAHNVGGWRPGGWLDKDICVALGVSADDLKNAKRRKFLSKSLPAGPALEKIIKDVAKKLKLRVTQQMRSVLVSC